jgi:hypothetical protein
VSRQQLTKTLPEFVVKPEQEIIFDEVAKTIASG